MMSFHIRILHEKKIFLIILIVVLSGISVWFGNTVLESSLGYTRTGRCKDISEVPLLGKKIPIFSVQEPVRFFVSKHPHGPILGIISGVTTEQEINRIVAEMGLKKTPVNENTVQKEIRDLFNQSHDHDPVTFPHQLPNDASFFVAREGGSEVLLGAFCHSNGMFYIRIQYHR